jgi:hypothetical protein
MDTILLLIVATSSTWKDGGPTSMYKPRDGHNRGQLACGGTFTAEQEHVAHRRWRKLGCGRKVVVYSRETQQLVATHVMDAGPFGITDGKGGWRCWTRSLTPPEGWRFRGAMDLSVALWRRLGRPRFLSRAKLFVVPEHVWQLVHAFRRPLRRPPPPSGRLRELSSAGHLLDAGPEVVQQSELGRDAVQLTQTARMHASRAGQVAFVDAHGASVLHQVEGDASPSAALCVRHQGLLGHASRVAA